MTDDKDRRLLLSLLSTFYCKEIEQDHYYLAPGDTYYIPPHGSYQVSLGPPEGSVNYFNIPKPTREILLLSNKHLVFGRQSLSKCRLHLSRKRRG